LRKEFEPERGKVRRGKSKVKLSLVLTKYHAMKTYRGVEVYLRTFLILIDKRNLDK
jgi:hypothetical protein